MGEQVCEGYVQTFGKNVFKSFLYFIIKPELVCTKLKVCQFKKEKMLYKDFANEVLTIPKKMQNLKEKSSQS